MGLDVLLWVENREELFPKDYDDPEYDHFHKHSLSRTFCNFMCRQHSSSGEPELDQIGRITAVDIQPIYDMEGYESESNNFGQDLRNFKRFLEYAKDKGATTVYFLYG